MQTQRLRAADTAQPSCPRLRGAKKVGESVAPKQLALILGAQRYTDLSGSDWWHREHGRVSGDRQQPGTHEQVHRNVKPGTEMCALSFK